MSSFKRTPIPLLIPALALTVAALSTSCHFFEKNRREETPDLRGVGPGHQPPAPRVKGLDLRARADGNLVRIFLTNHLDIPVTAGPKFFGVIERGAPDAIPFTHGVDVSQFPVRSVKPGETVQGFLRFKKFKDLVGMRLVYNCQQAKPVFCVIQPSQSAVSELPLQ